MNFFSKVKRLVMASAGTKIATALICLVVLLGGMAGVLYAVFSSKPEVIVGKAVIKTFTSEPMALEEVLGLDLLTREIRKQGMEAGVNAGFGTIPLDLGLGTMQVPEVAANVVLRQRPDKKSNLDLEVLIGGKRILAGWLYADEEQLQMRIDLVLLLKLIRVMLMVG